MTDERPRDTLWSTAARKVDQKAGAAQMQEERYKRGARNEEYSEKIQAERHAD